MLRQEHMRRLQRRQGEMCALSVTGNLQADGDSAESAADRRMPLVGLHPNQTAAIVIVRPQGDGRGGARSQTADPAFPSAVTWHVGDTQWTVYIIARSRELLAGEKLRVATIRVRGRAEYLCTVGTSTTPHDDEQAENEERATGHEELYRPLAGAT
jgi:hypothetical protein